VQLCTKLSFVLVWRNDSCCVLWSTKEASHLHQSQRTSTAAQVREIVSFSGLMDAQATGRAGPGRRGGLSFSVTDRSSSGLELTEPDADIDHIVFRGCFSAAAASARTTSVRASEPANWPVTNIIVLDMMFPSVGFFLSI